MSKINCKYTGGHYCHHKKLVWEVCSELLGKKCEHKEARVTETIAVLKDHLKTLVDVFCGPCKLARLKRCGSCSIVQYRLQLYPPKDETDDTHESVSEEAPP